MEEQIHTLYTVSSPNKQLQFLIASFVQEVTCLLTRGEVYHPCGPFLSYSEFPSFILLDYLKAVLFRQEPVGGATAASLGFAFHRL